MDNIIDTILKKLNTSKQIEDFFNIADPKSREDFVRNNPDEAYRAASIMPSLIRDVNSIYFNASEDRFIKDCYGLLGKEFIKQYADSSKYHHSAYFLSQILGAPIAREPIMSIKSNGVGLQELLDKQPKNGIAKRTYSRASDFRSMDEMINEGSKDGLKFEAYMLGHEDQVPFGNTQRNYPDSLQDGDPTSEIIGSIVYEMKKSGEWDKNQISK